MGKNRISATVEPTATTRPSSDNPSSPSPPAAAAETTTDNNKRTMSVTVKTKMSATNGVKKTRAMSSVRGSTLSFHSLDYYVKAAAPGRRCCCATADKQILHDVSGIFRPGMNAIMGPTGSGKTTLLDVLAGRTESHGIKGNILVDGQRPPKNFKCMTGYVVQDDVVMGTLTVRENLMFSANLRISTKVSHDEKCEKVDETIQELGLTSCADSKVGTEFIRGISGGERKRCNIGMELIISPEVLFLDEPTTGLDASTAFAVMALLQRLSLRGRTIIFSIHQPRYTIYRLFDRLSLLAHGRTVYHGIAHDALDYFQSIGHVCQSHNNPPDFFLDIINGDSTALSNVTGDEGGDVKPAVGDSASVDIPTADYDDTGPTPLAELLANKFNQSTWAQTAQAELEPILSTFQIHQQNNTLTELKGGQYATSFLTQLRHVSKRTVLNLLRSPQVSILQLSISIFFALVIGVIYLQLDQSYPAGLQNRVGSFFFIIMNQVFQNLSGVELFIRERVIFVHESASGFYCTSAYFFSKIFCDLFPMRLTPLCAFCVIAYFMIGFQVDVVKFFIFFLDLFLTTMAASAVCFAVSASVNVFAIANLLSVLVFILMMIFGGLLVNIASLPDWISWLQYLSIIRYSLNTLSINELHDMTFYDTTANGTSIPVLNGSDYLTSQGIKHDTAWDFWQNIMAIGIMAVGIMFLAYVQLRRMKKLK